jgi:hypothetical protein
MQNLAEFDLTHPDVIKAQFEERCRSLAVGSRIAISEQGKLVYLSNFDELTQRFPDLELAFKNQMKQQYQL